MPPYIHKHFESLLAEPTPILMDPEVGLQTMVEEGTILQAAVVTQLAHKHLIIVFITLLFQDIVIFL
jgi:hypothetical protein